MPRWPLPMMLAASLLVGGCTNAPGRGRRAAFGLDVDSATSSCRQSPTLCTKVGSEPPVVPLGRTARVLATATVAGEAALQVLDAATTARIEKALKECADEARSEVLLRRFGDRSPTPEECNQKVADGRDAPVTLAMQLGEEMHRVALACTQEKLSKLRPGGFSLEQRYRYDRRTRKVSLVSWEEVQTLLNQGRAIELLGTLVPDVVIHSGDPLRIQRVYDFKFPCVNGTSPPRWRTYPKGHPYADFSQKVMYQEALAEDVWGVAPRWGIF